MNGATLDRCFVVMLWITQNGGGTFPRNLVVNSRLRLQRCCQQTLRLSKEHSTSFTLRHVTVVSKGNATGVSNCQIFQPDVY